MFPHDSLNAYVTILFQNPVALEQVVSTQEQVETEAPLPSNLEIFRRINALLDNSLEASTALEASRASTLETTTSATTSQHQVN